MSRAKIFSLDKDNNELLCDNHDIEESQRRAQTTSSVAIGWDDIQNFESFNSFNN